jgi:hypothetical protein
MSSVHGVLRKHLIPRVRFTSARGLGVYNLATELGFSFQLALYLSEQKLSPTQGMESKSQDARLMRFFCSARRTCITCPRTSSWIPRFSKLSLRSTMSSVSGFTRIQNTEICMRNDKWCGACGRIFYPLLLLGFSRLLSLKASGEDCIE